MMKLFKSMRAMSAAVALFAGAATAGSASAGVSTVTFESSDNLENTGVTFGGSLAYDDALHLLTVNLANTSGFQSVITGFYFNIDGNASATYNVVDNVSTVGVNEGSFGSDTSLPPFGNWDAGVFLQNLSQQQVRGIDESETGTFTFNIGGADAGLLDARDFFTQTNSGGGLTGPFAVRYQSVGPNANQSDKVMGVMLDYIPDGDGGGGGGGGGGEDPPPQAIPLPPAVWAALSTMGLTGGLGSLRRRFRKA